MEMEIKIGIVEDHSEFRQGLGFLVSAVPGYEVAWAYGSAEEALKIGSEVDVMLLDINLPGLSGIEAVPQFKKRFPGQKIIMLTILEDAGHILNAISKGADGYILKKAHPQRIIEAIQQVYDGGAALTPVVARHVLECFKPAPGSGDGLSELTQREKEILKEVITGLTNEKIAEKLFISSQTVRSHIKNIYIKLQVHTRAEVVAKALKDKISLS
jgi:DNA-binding NarL/FixJ family response regulator